MKDGPDCECGICHNCNPGLMSQEELEIDYSYMERAAKAARDIPIPSVMALSDVDWKALGADPERLAVVGGVDFEGIVRHIRLDTHGRVVWAPGIEAERARAEEAIALLRAIWHSEGPDKWPDPREFRKRVEALVGEPPPSEWSNRFQG